MARKMTSKITQTACSTGRQGLAVRTPKIDRGQKIPRIKWSRLVTAAAESTQHADIGGGGVREDRENISWIRSSL